MKVKLYAAPRFLLDLTHDQVQTLIRLADSHDDYGCRQSSKIGGFLYGWLIATMPAFGVDSEMQCTASFNELDLVSKILENPLSLTLERQDHVLDFKMLIDKSLKAANVYIKNISVEIEELPITEREAQFEERFPELMADGYATLPTAQSKDRYLSNHRIAKFAVTQISSPPWEKK